MLEESKYSAYLRGLVDECPEARGLDGTWDLSWYAGLL